MTFLTTDTVAAPIKPRLIALLSWAAVIAHRLADRLTLSPDALLAARIRREAARAATDRLLR